MDAQPWGLSMLPFSGSRMGQMCGVGRLRQPRGPSSYSVTHQSLAGCSKCDLAKQLLGVGVEGWQGDREPPQWLQRLPQGEKTHTMNYEGGEMLSVCLVTVALNVTWSREKPPGPMFFHSVTWSHPSTPIYTNESFHFGGCTALTIWSPN